MLKEILDTLATILAVFTIFSCLKIGLLGGLRFIVSQIVNWILILPMALILIIPCLFHLWELMESPFEPGRMVDKWSLTVFGVNLLALVQFVSGNDEDGGSGEHAIVNGAPYMPTPAGYGKIRSWLYGSWRAWCWAGWRNFCDNLKYVFAWDKGEIYYLPYTFRGEQRVLRLGFQPETPKRVKVPVFSF